MNFTIYISITGRVNLKASSCRKPNRHERGDRNPVRERVIRRNYPKVCTTETEKNRSKALSGLTARRRTTNRRSKARRRTLRCPSERNKWAGPGSSKGLSLHNTAIKFVIGTITRD